MALTHGIKPIVTSGLVLCLDAGNIKSYPGIGTAWTDLSGRGGIGTLTNGPTYNSANGGSFSFDGIDDYVSSVSNLTLANNFSVSLWLRSTNSYPVQEKYISLGSDRIVIQSNENGNLSSYVTDSTQQNLLTWGNNGFGQLGINNTAISATPVTTFAGGTTWKQVASGGYHTAAIKTDGTLWTWGRNTSGQLGDFSNTNRSTPVTTFAGGTNWKQVTCGGLHTAAIKTDGTLWTWGSGGYGRLGTNNTGNRSTPVTTFAGGNNWKQVSMSNRCRHSAAIKTDGTLWIWGNGNNLGINLFGDANSRNTPVTTFAGGNTWKQVSVGYEFTAAVKTDGSLWTWGAGGQGRLGDNTIITRSTPVTTFAGGNNWKSVACGSNHIAAIKTDGSLWTWGYNNSGQLGTSDTTWRSTPVTTFAGGTNWKQVTCGNRHTGAIKTDGSLWTWGSDDFNALGRNGGGNQNVPVTTFAGGNNWKQVSFGEVYSAAIKTNGTFINDDDSNISLLNTKYYNISLTCNGTTIKIHLDSVEILSTTINGTLTSTDVSFTISSLLDCFKGNLAQASVYNRALTAAEIAQNYNALKSRYI